MSGRPVAFIGDAMAAVVRGITEVDALIGQPPVVVGGVAVMCRLSTPYRATMDLDVVDRLLGRVPQLQILRAADGAREVDPAAVLLPTPFGEVRVDVLEVRQIEIDRPSDDPGDRLHASSHAWANDTATPLTIQVNPTNGDSMHVTATVAEAGPLVAMKLQAVMNRAVAKQGTDLQDVVRLVLDPVVRDRLLDQIGSCDRQMAVDIAAHVELWLVRRRTDALRWIRAAAGNDLTLDDIDLTAELLLQSSAR